MINLNPICIAKKFFKGSFDIRRGYLFNVNTLGVNCVFDCECSNLFTKLKFNYMRNCLYELPPQIINLLVKYKVKIVFIDNLKIQSLTGESNILGLYVNNGRNQSIYINRSQNCFTLTDTIFHEIGHFMDKCIGDSYGKDNLNSLTDKVMVNYFKQEISSLTPFYFKCNCSELFAQIFSEVMRDNKEIIATAPKSSQYVFQLIKNLNKAS